MSLVIHTLWMRYLCHFSASTHIYIFHCFSSWLSNLAPTLFQKFEVKPYAIHAFQNIALFMMFHHHRVPWLAIQSLLNPLIHQLIQVYHMPILCLNVSAHHGLSNINDYSYCLSNLTKSPSVVLLSSSWRGLTNHKLLWLFQKLPSDYLCASHQ